jgi:hypothetical protein
MNLKHISQIISADVVDRLILLGQASSDAAWEVGDIVNHEWEQIESAGRTTPFTRMEWYKYVAELVGKSERTVRDWAGLAMFFPPEARGEYPPLSVDHFRLARSFGERWRECLDMAMRKMGVNNGRPPSVDWLEAAMRGGGVVLPPPDYELDAEMREFGGDVEMITGSTGKQAVGVIVRQAYDMLDSAMESGGVLNGFVAARLRVALQALSDALAVLEQV